MRRGKSRVYRWIAPMMTVALLAGQCDISVLAKESTVSQETSIFGEKKEEGKGGGASDSVDSDGKGDGAPKKDGEGESAENAGDDGSGNDGAEGGSGDDGAGDNGTGDGGDRDGAGDNGTGDGNGSGGEGAENSSGDGGSDNSVADGGENNGEGVGNGGVDDNIGNIDGGNSGAGDNIGNIDDEESDESSKEVNESDAGGQTKTVSMNGAANEDVGDYIEEQFVYDGMRYDVIGDGEVIVGRQDTKIKGDIFIPESVENAGITYCVTGIGRYAFEQCALLTSVRIPEGVVSIGEWAFASCSSLSTVEIPESVTSIGQCAFSRSPSLSSIEIPKGVTDIENATFYECRSLSDIEIPSSVTNIGFSAFYRCSSLISVEIPQSVTNIGSFAFYGCSSLTSVEIPQSVTNIGSSAFAGCSSLTSVEIPQSVTNIGSSAFVGCSSLISVAIPDRLISIEEFTFGGCSSLNNVVIPESVVSIGRGAFENCSGLTSVEIPKSVTDIGKEAFSRCGNLTCVTMSENITNIGSEAFYLCENLVELRITVLSGGKFRLPEASNAFSTIGDKRYILFIDDKGKELTGSAFSNARDIFIEAARSDDNFDRDDSKWYGWSLREPVEIKDTYLVFINVKKDGDVWGNHNRVFVLRADGDTEFITDLTQVPNGTYNIYDMTGINPDSYYSKAVDTGRDVKADGVDTNVDVTVQGAAAEAAVYYYTVTFYDGATQYPAGTSQVQQTVLRGHRAKEPAAPDKAGYRFTGWKTRDGGTTNFDFDKVVNEKTSVYAGWETAPVAETVTITATAGTGGTITPSGEVSVNKGESQAFQITANKGYHLKSVTADDKDVTAAVTGAKGVYTFANVNENHTITAAFEADTKKPSGSKPDGGKKPDDRKPKENNGLSDGGSTGETQTVSVVQTAAPSTANSVTPAVAASESEGAMSGKEPQTADPTPVEIYATVAMIAGLTYLLLYFMEEGRGMSEREKEVFVAAFIRWAKKGGRFRKCCAVAAIFCILVYYHSIGKRAHEKNFNREYLKQAL